ncbi:MAG: hypothetical protein QMD06_04705, partial [Candidatus Altarchaeum sp.]|nr:hypothetical protein [Candidatus Altarchaeum sp.]
MAKKTVNFYIDEDLLMEFDKLIGNRTKNLENAMKIYMNVKIDVNQCKENVKTNVKECKGDVNTDVKT